LIEIASAVPFSSGEKIGTDLGGNKAGNPLWIPCLYDVFPSI